LKFFRYGVGFWPGLRHWEAYARVIDEARKAVDHESAHGTLTGSSAPKVALLSRQRFQRFRARRVCGFLEFIRPSAGICAKIRTALCDGRCAPKPTPPRPKAATDEVCQAVMNEV